MIGFVKGVWCGCGGLVALSQAARSARLSGGGACRLFFFRPCLFVLRGVHCVHASLLLPPGLLLRSRRRAWVFPVRRVRLVRFALRGLWRAAWSRFRWLRVRVLLRVLRPPLPVLRVLLSRSRGRRSVPCGPGLSRLVKGVTYGCLGSLSPRVLAGVAGAVRSSRVARLLSALPVG